MSSPPHTHLLMPAAADDAAAAAMQANSDYAGMLIACD